MSHAFLPVLALTLAAPAAAQATWTRVLPEQQPRLASVHMRTALDVWIGGTAPGGGYARHSTNGGTTWLDSTIDAGHIEAVRFLLGPTGLAAGDGIHRTSDDGASWTRVDAHGGLRDLFFVDPLRGWAAGEGGLVLRTLDGGLSWSEVSPAGHGGALARVFFASTLEGWACGAGGAILHTVDGGASWTPQASGTSAALAGLSFASPTAGWAAGDGVVLRTLDGGASWSQVAFPAGAAASDVEAFTATRAFTAGTDGTIRETTDGGVSWTTRYSNPGAPLLDLDFGDFSNGVAAGENGAILRSTNGGASWTLVEGGAAGDVPWVLGFDALDAERAWAIDGTDGIWRTADGGASWDLTPVSSLILLRDVEMAGDGLHGYACGRKQGVWAVAAWTTNGGLSWDTWIPSSNFDMNTVAVAGDLVAIAAGDTHVFRTVNGGENWQFLSPPQPYGTYHGSAFGSSTTGWIVGSKIHRTSDAGASWSFQLDPPATLRDVSFVDSSTGWAVGDGGLVLHTSDGGASWQTQAAGTTSDLRGVTALDASTVWIAGAGGFVASSSDGGQSWQEDPAAGVLGAADVQAFEMIDAERGWIAGTFGTGVWKRALDPCAVVNYCDGKETSAGGTPAIAGAGAPARSGAGFDILVTGATPSQFGLLFYSASGRHDAPFLGGTLCVEPELTRLPLQVTDGQGTASFTIEVDARMPGTARWYQFWFRDPAQADGTGSGLTGGLEVHFCD